ETIAFDAGASFSTRNLAWDERTGEVLLTETVDEYNDKYYTMNYPAHWYYGGMGQAAMNIGFTGQLTEVGNGAYSYSAAVNGINYEAEDLLLPGDELEIEKIISPTSSTYAFGWVTSVNGTQFEIIDEAGNPLTGQSGKFTVIRSGHRNLQSAGIMNVTLMRNPLLDPVSEDLIPELGSNFLKSLQINNPWDEWRIINAGAVDYSDDWHVGCECGVNVSGGIYNPYRVNEKGVWRTKSSRTYLTGRNHQAEVTPRRQGFFTKFAPMYQKDSLLDAWEKDYNDWTYVAEVTQYSPYGFELENKDALDRYSAAQYGYNNTFPMAVGANTKYNEIGFDGFEDHFFKGCPYSSHFTFDDGARISAVHAHTGRYSIEVVGNSRVTMEKKLDCPSPGTGGGGTTTDPDDPSE
ncbi:MAG: hypothetical protein JKY09_04415, partial [Crocinitomicaceae bacterium]|nr:hypothetical protein [Crocinitomicaceae bacterium]